MDEMTLELNSPITEEQWDAITDVDFEHTDRVWFHTKNGKDVEFVKRKKGKWIEDNDSIVHGHCLRCGWPAVWQETDVFGMNYCPNCGAKMEGSDADNSTD